MRLEFVSFGYKHPEGVPKGAQFVFDVRRVRNPYHKKELRHTNGLHEKTAKYVLESQSGRETYNAISTALLRLAPGTKATGKGHAIIVGIGCTGGHHRSVALAQRLASAFQTLPGYDAVAIHRDLEKP